MAKAKSVTLADIAAEVGVSNVAVSKALSGKPGVSDELRNKIRQVAEQRGYVCGTSGKKGMNETGNIGVIVLNRYYSQAASFYGKLFELVVKALYEHQYYGILELLTDENEKAGVVPRVMQDKKVDGLICMGHIDEKYVLKMVDQTDLPVFCLDNYLPSARMDTVISDGYYGTYVLTNYLISQGHRRIGFVGSVDATCSIADRFWGYRKALRANGIDFEGTWEIPDRDEQGRTFEVILSSPGDMDAFVCNCDYTAFKLIQNLEHAGFMVPEDISVVGFDNYLPAGTGSGRITTYEVDMEQMAQVCVESLLRKIKHRSYIQGIQTVTGRIIYKDTVRMKNQMK